MLRLFGGIGLALVTFLVGVAVAPTRFTSRGVGSGTAGNGSFCSIGLYSSTWFERVGFWSCSFDNEVLAEEQFNKCKAESAVISAEETRILTEHNFPEVHYYCLSLLDNRSVLQICAESQSLIREFERQKVNTNRR